MANAQKRKGDAAEREAAQLIAALLELPARRKLGAGRTNDAGGDTGDIEGVPGHVIQIASWANVAAAARLKPVEAQQQAGNAALPFAASWVRFRGGTWRIVLTPEQWAASMTPDSHRPHLGKGALWGAPDLVAEGVEVLRDAAPHQDEDGNPCFHSERPSRRGVSTRFPHQKLPPRASVAEVERRIAEAQLWIAQRLPLSLMRANAADSWGVSNTRTINRYLDLARKRMVAELISNRLEHQAQHIYALYDCARRAMDAEQFSAAVGALRVIAEIGGLLRAPIKPPEAK